MNESIAMECQVYEKTLPAEFRPYVAVSLVQPYALFRQNEAGELAEFSIYNLKLQLPKWCDGSPLVSSSVPDESLFRCNVLETRPGTPSARTGILPALVTVSSLAAGRKLDVTLGRPLKLVLDVDKIRMLLFLMERMKMSSSDVEESPEASMWWAECYSAIQLKTNQMLVEMQMLPPEGIDTKTHPLATLFTVGFNEFRMKTAFHFDPVKQKMEKLLSGIVLKALCVKAEAGSGSTCQLCDPLNAECDVELLWPHWMHASSHSRPLSHFHFRADNLRMHIGPHQVMMVQLVQKFLDAVLIRSDETEDLKPELEEPAVQKEPEADEQHYQDDLRTGAFDFQVNIFHRLCEMLLPKLLLILL